MVHGRGGDLGKEFPTGGARADDQWLIGGPQGHRGPLGSEGRERKGSGPLPRLGWAGFTVVWAGARENVLRMFSLFEIIFQFNFQAGVK
jgi:hypothetical protein